MNKKRAILGLTVGVIGGVILALNTNWLAAFGVFLMIFGNNLEWSART